MFDIIEATPDRPAFLHPEGEEWKTLSWRQTGEGHERIRDARELLHAVAVIAGSFLPVFSTQPRLRATEISADGRTITFTFAGGGNLADRNRGHMDSAVFRFEDADHVSSRWTWYQDGKERWLEEIRLERRTTGR